MYELVCNTSSLKRCSLRMWDYKAGIGQEGVTSRTKPDVRMAETRDRSNFFDDSVRKRQKKKKRERKKSSKMRGEKSDPLTMRLVVVKKKGGQEIISQASSLTV